MQTTWTFYYDLILVCWGSRASSTIFQVVRFASWERVESIYRVKATPTYVCKSSVVKLSIWLSRCFAWVLQILWILFIFIWRPEVVQLKLDQPHWWCWPWATILFTVLSQWISLILTFQLAIGTLCLTHFIHFRILVYRQCNIWPSKNSDVRNWKYSNTLSRQFLLSLHLMLGLTISILILWDHYHHQMFSLTYSPVWTISHIGLNHFWLQISLLRQLLRHLLLAGLRDLEFPPSLQPIEEDSLNPIFGTTTKIAWDQMDSNNGLPYHCKCTGTTFILTTRGSLKMSGYSGLIITVDKDSDNDERHHVVTTMPTYFEKPMNLLLTRE